MTPRSTRQVMRSPQAWSDRVSLLCATLREFLSFWWSGRSCARFLPEEPDLQFLHSSPWGWSCPISLSLDTGCNGNWHGERVFSPEGRKTVAQGKRVLRAPPWVPIPSTEPLSPAIALFAIQDPLPARGRGLGVGVQAGAQEWLRTPPVSSMPTYG
jgi:hypothetical protein